MIRHLELKLDNGNKMCTDDDGDDASDNDSAIP